MQKLHIGFAVSHACKGLIVSETPPISSFEGDDAEKRITSTSLLDFAGP
tara:strand:- start:403 stop:549 length:147 start_codon:yes stop_codon:yes gene_type:complete